MQKMNLCFTAAFGKAEREIGISCKTAVFTRAWSGLTALPLYEPSMLLPLVKQRAEPGSYSQRQRL